MSLRLVPLPTDEFPRWMERSQREHEADLIELGTTEGEARTQAARSLRDVFPDRAPARGQAVFHLVDDSGSAVGYLWVGRDQSDDPTSWWVWDIVIDPARRGTGLGREGMELAESYARSQGATTLGLSVFGFNRAARTLYESLGFEITSVKMEKRLLET